MEEDNKLVPECYRTNQKRRVVTARKQDEKETDKWGIVIGLSIIAIIIVGGIFLLI